MLTMRFVLLLFTCHLDNLQPIHRFHCDFIMVVYVNQLAIKLLLAPKLALLLGTFYVDIFLKT
jgi:hypothetical protein